MTDDLVERLRDFDPHMMHEWEVTDEAADRIEQLEQELSISRMAQVVMDNGAEELTAENAKLRDALSKSRLAFARYVSAKPALALSEGKSHE